MANSNGGINELLFAHIITQQQYFRNLQMISLHLYKLKIIYHRVPKEGPTLLSKLARLRGCNLWVAVTFGELKYTSN